MLDLTYSKEKLEIKKLRIVIEQGANHVRPHSKHFDVKLTKRLK